jgi:hypothetical protein
VTDAIGKARWGGELDWDRVVDGTREIDEPIYWDDAETFLESVIPQFALDKWNGQPTRVVLCIEKDAIAGMLAPLCHGYHVPLLPFRGQLSDTMIYELAEHISLWDCEQVLCIYMGDFDPSGLAIDRAVFGDPQADDPDKKIGKLKKMLRDFFPDVTCRVDYTRIAIIADDLMDYPDFILDANPKDVNYRRFMRDRDGDARTLGVDALDHVELENRARAEILQHINHEMWQQQQAEYEQQLKKLRELIDGDE